MNNKNKLTTQVEKNTLLQSDPRNHQGKVTLVKSLKGIKELTTREQDLRKLNGKCVAIYGANGTGKSSLKDAILCEEENLVPNWETKDKPWVNQDIIFGEYYACFDDNLVNLVRGYNKNKIKFLNLEITNLAELLNNRENSIEEISRFYPDFLSLFKVDLEDIKKSIKFVDKAIDTWSCIRYLQKNAQESLWINMRSLWKNLVISIDNSCRLISRDDRSIYNFDNKNAPFAAKDFLTIYSLVEKEKKIEKTVMNNFFQKLRWFRKYLMLIYELISNFGYQNYNNEISQIVEHYMSIEGNLWGTKSNAFVSLKDLTKEKLRVIKKIWNKNAKQVQANLDLANNLLEPYNIEYEVTLNRTTIKNESKCSTTFGLRHKKSREIVASKLIEKCVSYGEFNIIALTLFISSVISRKPEKQNAIQILFDDPVSSYDLSKIHISLNIIKVRLLNDPQINRVIFLTHEKYFIKKIAIISKAGETKSAITTMAFQLIKDQFSKLKILNVYEEGDMFLVQKIKNNKDNNFHILSQIVAYRQHLEIKELIDEEEFREEKQVLNVVKKFNIDQLNENSFRILNKIGLSVNNKDDLMASMKKEPDFSLKENMLALRSWLVYICSRIYTKNNSFDFFARVKKELGNNLLGPKIKALLEKCVHYEFTLDSISHFSSYQFSADISKLDEITDLLFASRKKMFEIFDEVLKHFDVNYKFIRTVY